MFQNSFTAFFAKCFKFHADRRGNIAVIFALGLLPLLSFVGAAVDYSRASGARTSMQAALDSAVLMLSKDNSSGTWTAAQLTTKAQQYFAALYTNSEATNVVVSATYSNTSNGNQSIQMSASGNLSSQYMKVVGFPTMSFGTSATTSWGGSRQRVAIALDVTGSMASAGKMGAMQDAAKSLVTTLKNLAKSPEDIYVSIIPFAQMVNVSTSNKNQPWLKWDELGNCWSSASQNMNAYVSRFASRVSCQSNGGSWTASTNRNGWTGCVIDRDQPYDTTSDLPYNASTNYVAQFSIQNGSDVCPDELLLMTSVYTSAGTDSSTDTTTIKGKINSLTPAGGTNQAIGMAFAWTSLLPGVAPAKNGSYDYVDSIILLSDGLNTIDRWYGDGANPASQVDDRQKLLCDNIKKKVNGKAPAIYMIQVNTDGDDESSVLKYCADPGNFYVTKSANGIAGIFNSIGTSLSKLRVAR